MLIVAAVVTGAGVATAFQLLPRIPGYVVLALALGCWFAAPSVLNPGTEISDENYRAMGLFLLVALPIFMLVSEAFNRRRDRREATA